MKNFLKNVMIKVEYLIVGLFWTEKGYGKYSGFSFKNLAANRSQILYFNILILHFTLKIMKTYTVKVSFLIFFFVDNDA